METKPQVSLHRMTASNGRHIRIATKVTFADGRCVKFTERMPKGRAIAQAIQHLSREASR